MATLTEIFELRLTPSTVEALRQKAACERLKPTQWARRVIEEASQPEGGAKERPKAEVRENG